MTFVTRVPRVIFLQIREFTGKTTRFLNLEKEYLVSLTGNSVILF